MPRNRAGLWQHVTRWLVFAALVILLLPVGCGDDATSPMGEPVTWIRGRVHTIPDSRYGIIMLNSWRGAPELHVQQTLDIDGSFEFPVAEGVYEIRIEMPDHSRYYLQRDGSLGSGADSIIAIAGTETEFDVYLGSLLLTLDYPDGYHNEHVYFWLHPLDGIRSSRHQRGRTGPRDTYRLGHIPPGRYIYELSLGSEYPLFGLESEGTHIETLAVSADEEVAYDAVLPEPSWIEFEISDPTEVVLVSITSYPERSLRRSAHVSVDSNRMSFVGADSVFVQAYLGANRFLSPTGQSADTTILVLAPEESQTLPISVGRLFVSPHNPRVWLDLFEVDGGFAGSVNLASNPAIWADRFYGRVRPSAGYEQLGATHWLGGVPRRIDSEPIDATSGTDEISWAILPGGTVRGHFARPRNEYRNMAWIEVETPDWWLGARIVVADDGRTFEITNAPIGEFYLGYGVLGGPVYYPGTQDINSAEVIRIAPGQVIEGLSFLQ